MNFPDAPNDVTQVADIDDDLIFIASADDVAELLAINLADAQARIQETGQ